MDTVRTSSAGQTVCRWVVVGVATRPLWSCEALSTALPTEIFVGYSRPLGSGVVGQAAALGQTVLVSDASAWPDFVHTLPGGQSELAVPIRFGGQTLAVLNLESTRTGIPSLSFVLALAGLLTALTTGLWPLGITGLAMAVAYNNWAWARVELFPIPGEASAMARRVNRGTNIAVVIAMFISW